MLAWLNKTKRKRDESPDSEKDYPEACSSDGGVSVQGTEGAA